MSTKMEVLLQSELTEWLANARHWLLCMGTDLIWDNCWGLESPTLAGETCQLQIVFAMGSVQFSSVAQPCPILCNPMNCSMPGLPVHLLEFTQTHIHWVSDAIQPSHPLSSPSPPAFNLSQHQGLFKWVSCSHQMAKVLEFQLQHQSFQWTVGWYWALFQSLLHLFNRQSNPMRLIILSPLDRWENWVSIIYPRP